MREIVARDEKFVRQVIDRDEAIAFLREQGRKIQGGDHPGPAARRDYHAVSPGQLDRFVPRPAHAFHRRCRARVQADEGGWRLLAGRPPQRHAVAHLWHRLARPEGAGCLPAYAGGGGAPRSSPHRQGDGPVPPPGGGAGSVFWHPKGWKLYLAAEAYLRRRLNDAGYEEVKTPQLVDRSLWERSGHWEKYRQHMFIAEGRGRGQDARAEADELPVPCADFQQGLRSYRELPLRLAEFGSCHRYEPSGALHGIMRVRAFTQDDAHIFCTEEQIAAETVRFVELLASVYRDFGFPKFGVKFADRPAVAGRRGRGVGPGRGRAEGGVRHRRRQLHAEQGRGRLLRPQAGIRAARRYRPGLAMRHAAGRFHGAGPLGAEYVPEYGSRAPPGDAAPRHHGQFRALPRHR